MADEAFLEEPISGRWTEMRVLRIAAALVPLACLIAFVMFVIVATLRGGGEPTGNAVVADWMMRGLLIGVAASWVAVPLYIRHANGNERLQRNERKRWLFALRLYAPVAMSLYWWRYLR